MKRIDLMNMARGYWQSRVVLSAVELGIFEALENKGQKAAALARKIGGDERATELLLNALVGLGVLRQSGGLFTLCGELKPLFGKGKGSALAMLKHHAVLWDKWSRLSDSVKSGRIRPEAGKVGFHGGPAEAKAFTLAMRDGALPLAGAVVAELDLEGRKSLLDLGGGPGVYACEMARRYPLLEVSVVELPAVAEVGRELVAKEKDVRKRIHYVPSDIMSEELPDGADCAFLSHVIHAEGEEAVAALYARIAKALVPGGLLIVRDFFLDNKGALPSSNSLFALNMLVGTPRGRCYTLGESVAMLKWAGFKSATPKASAACPDAGYILARKALR
ncbi:MAG: methyltransferase domain-containing protein [Planctomycetes bacterium]|nr:methyltransferase domain-containing protein [Planctomycetota bacterium]